MTSSKSSQTNSPSQTNKENMAEPVEVPFENPNRKVWKQKVFNNSSASNEANDALYEGLHKVLQSFEKSRDFKPLMQYLSINHTQLVQAWSLYSQINDHKKVTQSLLNLTAIFEQVNKNSTDCPEQLFEICGQIVRSILTSYTKTLYRAINNMRGSLTNPTLRMMTGIVSLQNGKYVDEFISHFDFSLPSLCKLLIPSKVEVASTEPKNQYLTLRFNFIKFFIALVRNAPAILRKDILIDNSKLMSNWFKYIVKVDSDDLIIETLDFLSESILLETSFKKSTKCKIINEFILLNLHKLYNSTNSTIVSKVNAFCVTFATDVKYGVVYDNDKPWHTEVYETTGNNRQGNGVQIYANNKTFRLYNKLLYTMLTQYKPWEDDLQCTTVIKILKTIPEFVAPYSNYLIATHGSHEPKMSSYWFGQTQLLGKIIQLPIPASVQAVDSDALPNIEIVLDNIIPLPITRVSLRKCLTHETQLIRQMGCQITIFILQKLDAILKLYNNKGWNEHIAPLLNSVLARLPEAGDYVTVLNDTYVSHKDNKLLMLSATIIFKLYTKIFPANSAIVLPSANIYTELMAGSQNSSKSLSGVELVILDNYLEFQQVNDSHKWWNKEKNGNSLFTALLRICSAPETSPSMASKISALLQNLVSYTLMFDNKKLLGSPNDALVESLLNVFSVSKPVNAMWNLIDEAVSRCVRTPYKYIDMSIDYEHCSPFFVSLCEQFGFIKKDDENYELISKWLCMFGRNLVIMGDSPKLKNLLTEKTDIDESVVSCYLDFKEESFLKLSTDPSFFLSHKKETSYYRFITVSSITDLQSYGSGPLGMLDVAGAFFRLQCTVLGDTGHVKNNAKPVIQSLIARIGQFIKTHPHLQSHFSKPSLFEYALVSANDDKSIKEKKLYTLLCLLDVFAQVSITVDGLDQKVVALFDNYDEIKSTFSDIDVFQAIIEYLPITFLHDIATKKLHESDELLSLSIALSSDVRFTFDELVDLSSHYQSAKIDHLVGGFFERCQDVDGTSCLETLIGMESRVLLQSFVLSYSLESGEYLTKIPIADSKHLDLLIFIGTLIPQLSGEVAQPLVVAAFDIFQTNKQDVKAVLPFLTSHIALLSEQDKTNIYEYLLNEYEDKYCSEVAKFVYASAKFSDAAFKVWLHKCMLYINKKVALATGPGSLNSGFVKFLADIDQILNKVHVWSFVPHAILNSQLEIILTQSFFFTEEMLKHCIQVTIKASKYIESSKLLQILLNNEHNPLKSKKGCRNVNYHFAVLLYVLFNKDPANNSNVGTQDLVLSCYNANMAPEDCILYEILQIMESTISSSWTNNIYAWDFLDNLSTAEMEVIGEAKLIVKEREGLVITMSKNVIDYTLKNFVVSAPQPPSASAKWSEWEAYALNYQLLDQDVVYNVYDTRFIMLLSLHNKELVQKAHNDENGSVHTRFDMLKLLRSQLFSLFIVSLSAKNEASDIALKILTQMAHCCGNDEKLDVVFKVLLKKIVFTFVDSSDRKPSDFCSPLYWYAVADLCNSLQDPRSFLYEKTFRWVFAAPKLRFNDIPLFKQLVDFSVHANDAEDYYKYVFWFLNVLENGIKTNEDVNFIRKTKIVEWVLNLQNSPYINHKVHVKVDRVVAKIQSIYSKSGCLVSGFACLSHLEASVYSTAYTINQLEKLHSKNSKNMRIFKECLNAKEDQVNKKNLALRFKEITNSNKRLSEWCNNEEETFVKRVCL